MLSLFRRHRIVADERDAEYAAAITDDGAFPSFPYLMTPDRVEYLRGVGVSEITLAALTSDIPASRALYPLCYTRLLATAPARAVRNEQERLASEQEEMFVAVAVEHARTQYRAALTAVHA